MKACLFLRMFFSNSFSASAVDRAAHWIRFLDNLEFLLTKVHEAEHQDDLLQFYRNAHLGMFDSAKIESAKRFGLFQNGIFLGVLEHLFDGSKTDFKKFEKEAIIKAGNYGFGANVGKTLHKDYLKSKSQYSQYKNAGMDWAEEFYIPTIIEQNLNLEDIEEHLYRQDEEKSTDWLIDDPVGTEESDENVNDIEKSQGISVPYIADEDLGFQLENNEKERYELYLKMWEMEKSGTGREVFSEEFWNKTKDLNFYDFDTFPKDLKHCWDQQKIYQVHTDKQLLFAIPNLIFDILASVHFDVEILVRVPTQQKNQEMSFVEKSFFKFRDLCLTNKLSFSNLACDFPENGRLFVDGNLVFKTVISLTAEPNYSEHVYIQELTPMLDSLEKTDFGRKTKKFLKPDNDEIEALIIQELSSIEEQLIYDFKKTHDGVMSLKDRLGNRFNSSHQNYNVFQKAEAKYLQKNPMTREQALHNLKNAHLNIYGYTADDDGQYDSDFMVGFKLKETQRVFYEKTGSYFDTFDISVLKKLNQYGFKLDESLLKKGLGICPVTVSTALRLERILAPYILNQEQKQKFIKLREPLEDKYSLELGDAF